MALFSLPVEEIAALNRERGRRPGAGAARAARDLELAVDLRHVAAGADPFLRTRIDDCATALDEAERAGYDEGAARLRAAMQAARLPRDV